MRPRHLAFLVALTAPLTVSAQDGPFKVEPLKEGPPKALAGPVKEALGAEGYRITDGRGKAFLDLWVRKAVPASARPSGPKGAILFPSLAEGELLGAARYAVEGHDYRDQAIAPGVYTVRYGLQPVNGDHLGVSENRDYGLLLPASKDREVATLGRKALESESAEAAGTNHPAVLYMVAAPADAKGDVPALVRDETKMLWGLVLALPLEVKGESGKANLPVQLIVVGAAMQ